ncbi:neuronal acetylcholine receptor subunit alpha-7-like [Liolophura sinensis]|uniref:neuronal acetylcholine receptor subunit alpha-7-like n=1 Tax=Liolophura sinensis TaxID=3198878 RepID=UPI003159701F
MWRVITWNLPIVTFLLLLFGKVTHQGKYTRLLLKHLFEDQPYNVLERPVVDESSSVNVTFGLTLQQIIDVDEKRQVILTNVWLELDEKNQILYASIWLDMTWRDPNLMWNAAEFNNISELRVPIKKIWRPDILMYNSADDRFDGTFPVNAILFSTGDINWIPPGMFKSTCKINILWFPFDEQSCDLKFGSWTYASVALDLVIKDPRGGDTQSFIRNGEWDLIDVPVKRNTRVYACCPDKDYPDITFTVRIRRRTLYYGFNIILPCVLISSMALLTFILPPDGGEKISLGVTIMLSLMVFLLLVAETMPPTSDAVPLIGIYFALIMIMCSLSVMCTVIVLNFHHRGPDTHHMSKWVNKIICEWLAWILMMERPGKEISRKTLMQNSKLRDIEMSDRTSKSLLANVLDLDDDCPVPVYNKSNASTLSRRMEDGMPTVNHRNELLLILKELKKMTSKLKKDDEESDIRSDWKFAAMVIDRLCLWIFTILTLVSTIGILCAAPQIQS